MRATGRVADSHEESDTPDLLLAMPQSAFETQPSTSVMKRWAVAAQTACYQVLPQVWVSVDAVPYTQGTCTP